MLHEFLTDNRTQLIERCRSNVIQRPAPGANKKGLEHGIPSFLDQLIKTLRVEQGAEPMESREISGPSVSGNPVFSEVGETATLHGRELLQHGFTVEQVVHDYGDLCQAITNLAVEHEEPISTDEFRTLNRCLDNATAEAVTEFNYQHDIEMADEQEQDLIRRLGYLSHELRNLVSTATLALSAIKSGHVALNGATGAILDRSLVSMVSLIDRSLAEVRITAGVPLRHQLFALDGFIAEVKVSASLQAHVKGSVFTVSAVDPSLAVEADRDLLLAAVGNLLQNAFKFTHRGSEVTLNAYAVADRILIEVEDHCGGLPAGDVEKMFLPFTQESADKSGLGLGLSISRRSVEANGGVLRVRDIPGSGCVFTIDLPRHSLPEHASPASTLIG